MADCKQSVQGALLNRSGWTGPGLAAAAVLVALSGAAKAQPTITNLGTFAGGTSSFANAISSNGLVVTGSSDGPPVSHAFRWTAAGGMQDLGIIGNGNYSTGGALSADGSVVVGISAMPSGQNRAFRWTAATGMVSLGVLGSGSASNANGVNADGSVVTGGSYTSGFTNFRAFRWTAAAGLQNIGTLPGGQAPDAFGISADGSVVAGTDNVSGYSRAFRWTAAGGMQDLGSLPTADSGYSRAVNAGGSTVVGYSGDQLNGTWNHAFRWTGASGMQDLGVLPGSVFSAANSVSADGSVIVGFSTIAGDDHAMLWTSSLGMVDLGAYLAAQGTNVTGWVFQSATGISADGSAIAGYGTFNDLPRAFVVRGPALAGQCSAGWVPGIGVPGVSGNLPTAMFVSSMITWDPDGAGPQPPLLVVAGRFNNAGGVAANNIATWNPTTGAWGTLGSGMNGFALHALAVLPNGQLVAGGQFTTAGGVPANNIARWNGSTWAALGVGTTDEVSAIAVMPNGDLVAGGSFAGAGGSTVNFIARWNGSAWSPLGPGFDTAVDGLLALPNGDLIAGGDFNATATGLPLRHVARWSGGAWSPLGAGVGTEFDYVLTLAALPNGNLVAGGNFTTPANGMAQWDGSSWSALGTGLSSAAVESLMVLPGGDLIAAGHFSNAGAVAASNIARWDGSAWSALGAGVSGSGYPIVYGLGLLPGGDAVVGGIFGSAGGATVTNIARYSFGTPSIAAQAQDATACASGSVMFSVVPAGTGPFTYQWRKGGVTISAASNPSALTATLTLANVQASDAGSYDCIVSNSCGSATSLTARLFINSADFNNDGDTATDADIEDFFACLAGNCCATCGSADFNGDGDTATDADIEAFFRVLAGGNC